MSLIVQCLLFAAPWGVRRALLKRLYGFDIHPTARIGFSIINAKDVSLKEGGRIGHLNMIKGLDHLQVGPFSKIGNLNWITGFPTGGGSGHFADQPDRCPALHVEAHSAITHRHMIDCTDTVRIGRFSTFGGWRSQILTHGIDIRECRQRSAPVTIGDYCFVSTSVVLLKGSGLPDYSVLAAGAVLTEKMTDTYAIYGGVPARKVSSIEDTSLYFKRDTGYVW